MITEGSGFLLVAAMAIGFAAFVVGATLVFLREFRFGVDARRKLVEAETDRLRAERLFSSRR